MDKQKSVLMRMHEPMCVPTTQECRADLGKQVSLHGTGGNFPKFRFFCEENVHLSTYKIVRSDYFYYTALCPTL